jgi:hypothetical protein
VTTEEVSSVLLSADGKQLVVLTKERHFVFRPPARLVAALRSSFHDVLVAEISVVDIQPNADVSVRVSLSMTTGGDEARRDALALGFEPKWGDPTTLELKLPLLEGVVYKANDVRVSKAVNLPLNQTYRVTVAETGRGLGYRDLPSPVRATAEGVLAIAAVPLAVIAAPFIVFVIPRGVGFGP